jgi:hypothetical protein
VLNRAGPAYVEGAESFAGMNEREFAAQQLLPFLKQVGPIEAVWAMTTALEALEALPEDPVAAAAAALDESIAEFSDLAEAAETPPGEQTEPPAAVGDPPVADPADSGKKGAKAG